MTITLEVCVEDTAGLDACVEGGADRIELCSALAVGGLTPSYGLMKAAAASPIPVFAMIRPRAGDFRFSPRDIAQMRNDVAAARDLRLAGVVLGAANEDRLDEAALGLLIREAGGLGLTLHRVVDTLPDRLDAIERAIGLGFHRILTSGGAMRAPDGLAEIAAMQARAAGRVEIMAGSGVDAGNARRLIRETGISAVHASCSEAVAADAALAAFGFAPKEGRRTSAARIKALKTVLAGNEA